MYLQKTKMRMQFYPKCFKLHNFIENYVDVNDSFIDCYQGNTKFDSIKRKVLYLITKDLSHLFGRDELLIGEDAFYSTGVCYMGEEDWILDLYDNIFSLAGYNYKIFIKNIHKISRSLKKSNCLKIICRSESIRDSMIKYFPSKITDKIILDKPSFPRKKYTKSKSDKLRMLFIGSTNNKGDFYQKGGLYALEVCEELKRRNIPVSLVLRCKVPKELEERVRKNKSISYIDHIIPDKELDYLYENTDILLSLNQTFVLMTTLEAKSYNIPIIAFDTYSVRDYIKDGIDGYIIDTPKNLERFYLDKKYPTNIRTKQFENELKIIDKRIVRNICKIIIMEIKK